MSDHSIYRVMIENALDAFFLTKPDGTILDANAAACSMFGYSLDEFKIIGRQGIIDPESPGLAELLVERKEKGKIICELIGVKKMARNFLSGYLLSSLKRKEKRKNFYHHSGYY